MKIQKQISILFCTLLVGIFAGCSTQSSGSHIVQGRYGSGAPAKAAKEAVQDTETEEIEETLELFVVTRIDTEMKNISFQLVGSGRQSEYVYDTGTQFLDKYGNTKSVSSFIPGDVVEVQATGVDKPLRCVQLSDDVWVQDEITNYTIDENICALTIGKTKYQYDKELEAFSGDNTIKMRNISKSDEIRVVGMDKQVLSVAITKGHGYLTLANTKLFEGSFICVGEKIFQEVTPNMQIEVPEGTHLVTVANKGYGGSKEVEIARNKTTRLDLDKLKGEGPKICKITFKVGVEGAVLQIDGEEVDYSKPVEVPYGVHKIAVLAEGYDTISEKLVVNSKEAEIEIALTSATGEETEVSGNDNTAANNGSANNGSTNNNSTNNSNTNSSNTNNNNTNNSNTNNSNTNTDGTNSNSTDYLTTLYNLLNSVNNTNNSTNSNSNTTTNNTGATEGYDDLHDG